MNSFSIQSGNTVQIFYNDYVIGTADSSEFSKTGPSSEGKEDGTCFIKGKDSILTSTILLLKKSDFCSKFFVTFCISIPQSSH